MDDSREKIEDTEQMTESRDYGDFETVITPLSVRARHVLERLGVADFEALKKLSSDDLIQAWSCGRRTRAEIEELKTSLWPSKEKDVDQESGFSFDFDSVPGEVFNALLGVLSVRGVHALGDLKVDSISSFMKLNRNTLLKCRNCGRKTADEVLRLQSQINAYARHLSDNDRILPGQLLEAPCLAGLTKNHVNSGASGDFRVDVDNPSEWLIEWIEKLARSKKQAQAFMLRKGMLGMPPMTLESVGEQLGGITRERARQMEKALEKKASTSYQQQRLRPLFDVASTIVKQMGGMVGLGDLTKSLFGKGNNGHQLSYATDLIEFFSSFDSWKAAGLRLVKGGVVKHGDSLPLIRSLSGVVEEIASSSADERHSENLWSIDREHLKKAMLEHKSLSRGVSHLEKLSDELLDAVIKKCKTRMKIHGRRVYSIDLFRIRFGTVVQMLDIILRDIKHPMHFTDIANQVINWRPTFNERNVHASLDRVPTALLWDRGTFVHRDNVVIPYSLINDIERWLFNVLSEDVPFISIYGAFCHFSSRCERAGFPSEVALYTCLRQSSHSDLVFPRFPRVYLKNSYKDHIPMVVVFEDFLRDAGGRVSQQEAKEFGLDKIFLKDFQFYQLSQQVSNVIRTGDWGFIHLDNLALDSDSLQPLFQFANDLLEQNTHCSINKVYREKQVTCRILGIDGPVMLYSLFQCFAEEKFILDGYPQLARNSAQEKKRSQTIGKHVLDYLLKSVKPCTYENIEKLFVEKLGYKEQQVYTINRDANVCQYHPGCVVHLKTLEWNQEKQRVLEQVAFRIYEDSCRAGNCFGRISYVVESNALPKLPHGLHWSRAMISDLLKKGDNFLVLGNARDAFVAKDNKDGIRNLEGLIATILDHEWGGAANLAAFEKLLIRSGVLKRRLTKSMLGSDNSAVVIRNGEVFLRELLVDA